METQMGCEAMVFLRIRRSLGGSRSYRFCRRRGFRLLPPGPHRGIRLFELIRLRSLIHLRGVRVNRVGRVRGVCPGAAVVVDGLWVFIPRSFFLPRFF